MSPFRSRHAPACCDANAAHGFVLATEVYAEGIDVLGNAWETMVADAAGIMHALPVQRCPACARHLRGVACVTLQAWSLSESVRAAAQKVRDAATELERALAEERRR